MALYKSYYYGAFKALCSREWRLFKKEIFEVLIAGVIFGGTPVLVVGLFLPQLGLAPELIPQFMLGHLAFTGLSASHPRALRLVYDIRNSKRITYQLGLPIPRALIYGSYLVSFLLNALLLFIFVFTLIYTMSTWVIPGGLPLRPFSLTMVLFYLVASLFYSLFFLALGMTTSVSFYLYDVWPFLLGPMMMAGGVFFSWYRVYEYAPNWALACLLSPLIYCSEGVRSIFLDVPGPFLSPALCITMLSVLSLLCAGVISVRVPKRFDSL